MLGSESSKVLDYTLFSALDPHNSGYYYLLYFFHYDNIYKWTYKTIDIFYNYYLYFNCNYPFYSFSNFLKNRKKTLLCFFFTNKVVEGGGYVFRFIKKTREVTFSQIHKIKLSYAPARKPSFLLKIIKQFLSYRQCDEKQFLERNC